MGTSYVLVACHADASTLDRAEATLADLERRWSRFVDDSEISILNRATGAPVVVSPDTFEVVRAAVEGSIATKGRYDPTVHDSMMALGYDRTFDDIDGRRALDPVAAPGVEGIELDEALHAVTLPPGVRIDLGGIGKGTAADIVSAQVMADGAGGIAVSIGGDIRVRGESPSGRGWAFTYDNEPVALPPVHDGGVCTSSTRRRRWSTAAGEAHHLVDPTTGTPTDDTIESITVMGATAQQAEVLTKAAMVAGCGATAFLAPFGVQSVIRHVTPVRG